MRQLFSESTCFNLLIQLISSKTNTEQNIETENKMEKSQLKKFAFTAFQTMFGFILILDWSGKILYVTETAAVHLGLSQVLFCLQKPLFCWIKRN